LYKNPRDITDATEYRSTNLLSHQNNVSEQIHQDNSTADMSPVNNLPDEENGSHNDENSAVTRTSCRSGQVVKPPKRFDPAKT